MDGLVLMGSTGEFFSMSMETQKAYIDFAAKILTGRTRIFIGTTRMNLAETIELTNYSVSKGLNEVMIVSPYYFLPAGDFSGRMVQSDCRAYRCAHLPLQFSGPHRT